MTELEIPEVEDPWIAAYLAFVAAYEAGGLARLADFEEFERTLPTQPPGIPAAMFITADAPMRYQGESAPIAELWVRRASPAHRPPPSGLWVPPAAVP